MPVFLLPIISGIGTALRFPALAAFLATIAANIVSFFAKYVTQKVAIQLGIITLLLSGTAIVIVSFKALILGVSVVSPPELTQAISMCMPSNFPLCIGSIITAKTIRYVWIWKIHLIELAAR